jgi:glyoxylate utilization-related uncharacterized protein
MFRYVDASDQGVHFMPRRQLMETDWSVPGSDTIGYMRTVCRGYMGSGASLALGITPVGQRSPIHDSTGEHLLLQLKGEITWRIKGHGDVVTAEMDLVFIGAGQTYEYFNSGLETAHFVDVIGRVGEWPHSAVYESVSGSAGPGDVTVDHPMS